MKRQSKKTTLHNIVVCCENRFNHGLVAEWKHSDFVNLNFDIMQDTGVNISPNTLKRIFGKIAVDDDYLPQQAIIEALQKYGRYSPQETEKLPESLPFQDISLENKAVFLENQDVFQTNKPLFLQKNKVLIGIFCTLFTLGAGFFILKFSTSNKSPLGSIALSRTEGFLPQTVYFDLQVPNREDSVFVNFGDKAPLLYVNPLQKMVAHNYLFPGVFTVKLQTRQEKIDSTKVYVRSDKWVGLGFHNQENFDNRYYQFPAVKTGKDSLFHINNRELHKMGMDTVGLMYIRLCNYTPTGYDSDSFIFETSFKSKAHEDGIYCNITQFLISGSNGGMIRFKFVSPGCSMWVLNNVSEQVFDGSKSDLSPFVTDLNSWNTVKLINNNKHISLFLNGKLLFEGNYTQPLGEIAGLFFEFKGNGFIKNCNLSTPDGKNLYHF
jgi:hypothetical protein